MFIGLEEKKVTHIKWENTFHVKFENSIFVHYSYIILSFFTLLNLFSLQFIWLVKNGYRCLYLFSINQSINRLISWINSNTLYFKCAALTFISLNHNLMKCNDHIRSHIAVLDLLNPDLDLKIIIMNLLIPFKMFKMLTLYFIELNLKLKLPLVVPTLSYLARPACNFWAAIRTIRTNLLIFLIWFKHYTLWTPIFNNILWHCRILYVVKINILCDPFILLEESLKNCLEASTHTIIANITIILLQVKVNCIFWEFIWKSI